MSNFRATISYDGTDFSGVAEQLNGSDEKPIRTVIGELRPLIAMVAQAEPKIVVSGRTDKGVHAKEQVISFSFDQETDFDYDRLAYVCNRKLNPEINVHTIEPCSDDFHARFSAKSRTYRYFIHNSGDSDFTLSRYVWNIQAPLNLGAMNAGAKYFVGEQDFTSVCKKDESMPHNIREVFSAEFIDAECGPSLLGSTSGLLCFQIHANAFCWNMVRSIVGVLVDVGRGAIEPREVEVLLENKRRDSSRSFAPAHGLFLWNVDFGL